MVTHLEFLFFLTRPEGHDITPHQHNCHELVYYVSGEGQTTIQGQAYAYAKGNFAIMKPQTLHDEIHTKDTEVLFIGFHANQLPVRLPHGVFKDTAQEDIFTQLQKLKSEMMEKKAFYEQKLEVVLQDLLIDVVRLISKESATTKSLAHVERFMQENFTHDMDFESLARLTGYSYHRFRHLFKETYGNSPHQFLINLRLENACKLLANSTLSVTAIAHENGFASESQFCSLFKRTYGCTPGEYKRKAMTVTS